MSSAPDSPRGEEKLRLILAQLASLRARINGLAYQQAIFVGLALLIGAGAIIMAGAFVLPPLPFLISGATAAVICFAGLAMAGRHVWRARKDAEAVAALADERAELKGRLLTLTAGHSHGLRSALWPYLLEDAMLRREEFAPARIERHRISRTLYCLIAALALAALATPLARGGRRPAALAKHSIPPLTLNLRDLNIQPSDRPSSSDNARLSGDAKTMRKLAQMMAEARRKERNKDLLSRMKRSAQDLAGNLQDRITGRKAPPLDIRLADNGPNPSQQPPAAPNLGNPPDSRGPQSDNPGSGKNSNQPPAAGAVETQPGGSQGSLAMQSPPGKPHAGPQPDTDSRPFVDPQRSGNDDAGGASHGAGTDPEGLYGPPEVDARSEGSFQIAIDARPGASGHAANRAYPPKVNAPLNADQHPDEPISRAAVPAEDRSTIKRIFER